jgi:uncharacterized protein YdeI (YjbR/CyaY-like superfamily)
MNEENHNLSKLLDGTPGYSDTKLIICEGRSTKQISSGVVHELPADLKKALTSDPQALTAWEDITPLARNEWICWIESAKKAETRSRRIEWLFKP